MSVRLIDTNIVSYLFNRHSLALAYAPHLIGYSLAISFQTVAELLEGARRARWGAKRWNDLEALIGSMTVLESDRSMCDYWAEVRTVRRMQPIGVADAWVAATALAYGLELVTHNPADFAAIPGLTVVTEAP